jgi:hypothetical protein
MLRGAAAAATQIVLSNIYMLCTPHRDAQSAAAAADNLLKCQGLSPDMVHSCKVLLLLLLLLPHRIYTGSTVQHVHAVLF